MTARSSTGGAPRFEREGCRFDSDRASRLEGDTWQDNYNVVSSVEASGRTAFSVATEPGDVRHAFKSSGKRRNAGWSTVLSLQQPLVSGLQSLDEGYWRDRAAMCPTFNRDHQGSNPCASIALLVQRISTPRYERGDMGSSPVEGICGRSSDGRAAV